MRKFRLQSKVRDWLLVGFYFGFAGPVFVIALWAALRGEYPVTFRLVIGLAFFAIIVFAGFLILGQRLGLLSGLEDPPDVRGEGA